MFFLVDNNKKLIIGWSAKCGCTHVKILWQFLINNVTDISLFNHESPYLKEIHENSYESEINKIPKEKLESYKVLLIIRNPYERLISGFIDKYCKDKMFLNNFTADNLTFKIFVDELYNYGLKNIDNHHFTKQLSEQWYYFYNAAAPFEKCKDVTFMDMKNIDYSILEKIYEKKIPDDFKFFKGSHANNKTKNTSLDKVYNIPSKNLINNKPLSQCFYNDDIYNKVTEIYKDDLDLFKIHGFNYNIIYK